MKRARTVFVLAGAVALGACADSSTETPRAAPAVAAAGPTATDESTTDSTASDQPVDDRGIEDMAIDSATTDGPHEEHDDHVEADDLLPAYLGAAPFQDVAVAEGAGWVSTLDTLGCFEQPGVGGMGVHWLNESLLDDRVDAAMPEALVYELDADGEVAGLVGHEYLVPFNAWTEPEPPTLFGLDFHQHPTLPFWILHAYVWKDNPAGMFADWNPAVRMCPDGVTVFGEDDAQGTESDVRESADPDPESGFTKAGPL